MRIADEKETGEEQIERKNVIERRRKYLYQFKIVVTSLCFTCLFYDTNSYRRLLPLCPNCGLWAWLCARCRRLPSHSNNRSSLRLPIRILSNVVIVHSAIETICLLVIGVRLQSALSVRFNWWNDLPTVISGENDAPQSTLFFLVFICQ